MGQVGRYMVRRPTEHLMGGVGRRVEQLRPTFGMFMLLERQFQSSWGLPFLRNRRSILGVTRHTHLGWGTTLGEELEVCETEGNHYTMYAEPNLECLAQKVRESLQHAEQRWQQQIGQTGVRQIA